MEDSYMQVICIGYIYCMLIIIKLYFFNINEKFYGIFISRYFLCIYMYINVDIDNNNFYFLIVLYVKLMKYMIYKNN